MAEYAVPILPSRDLQETLAFYERLGFENRGTPPEEWNYMILGRGGIELHFIAAPSTDSLTSAASCYLFVPDADQLHGEWQEVVAASEPDTGSRLEAPINTDYGMREFVVVDQSGNRVRVGSALAQ